MECKFQPYEGKEPYIFVSYCHRDAELVEVILNRLYDLGFRIWYDEGIEWGSDWPTVVARHLINSQVVLAFYSGEFMASEPCRQEVHTAVGKKKKLKPIYLEKDVELEPGLLLRTSLCNALRYWEFRDKEKFYKKLMMESAVKACLDPERADMVQDQPQFGQLSPLWSADKKRKIADAAQRERKAAEESEQAVSYCHCVECGGRVNEDTVLFDMSGLYPQGLSVLPLRMTETELRRLQRDGEYIQGRTFQCAMSLGEILSVMADGKNLNDPVAAELTAEQLRDFANGGTAWESDSGVPQGGLRRILWDCSENGTLDRLRGDALTLVNNLDDRGNMSFTLELIGEKGPGGGEIITSVMISRSRLGKRLMEKRVCPHCKKELFRRAGTAEHKVVTFLGPEGSGKTGVLQALVHYASNHASFIRNHPVWREAMPVPQLSTMELLSASPELMDQNRFEQGLAPLSTCTDAGTGGVSVTFRVREKAASQGAAARETILTLVELPGAVCSSGGELDRNRIINLYPIVLDSSAVVVCHNVHRSGETVNDKGHAVEDIRNLGTLADQFQNMLVNVGVRGSIPMLLLFTACPDLERAALQPKPMVFPSPVQRIYQMSQERGQMEKSPYYKKMIQVFSNSGTINAGFRAEMRCSAFGRLPESGNLLTDGTPVWSQPAAVKPVNIDRLMRWVLMVTGCVAIHTPLNVRGRISRKQFRMENPLFENNVVPVEAALRCSLFSNPGVHDVYLVESLENKIALASRKMVMKPNSNHQD